MPQLLHQQLQELGLLDDGDTSLAHMPMVVEDRVFSGLQQRQALIQENGHWVGCDKSQRDVLQLSSGSEQQQSMSQSSGTSSLQTQMMKQVRTREEVEERKEIATKRLCMMNGLRELQKQALKCLEDCKSSAVIVMPTGSGKTTLIWTLKVDGLCSVIFAPYRILVSQLHAIFKEKGTTFVWPFHEEQASMDGVLATAQYVLLPYEAAPSCVGFISELHRWKRLGPIWVDEVNTYCCLYVTVTHDWVYVTRTQVHSLCTTGRFRESFNNFWNLGANLGIQGIAPRFIGLTATLRQEDVPDVMRRMSIYKAVRV